MPPALRPGRRALVMKTCCPAFDGICAAHIEEEATVTDHGTEILTKFPAQELFIANKH
jgi:Xaa-Pro aminopeptidase